MSTSAVLLSLSGRSLSHKPTLLDRVPQWNSQKSFSQCQTTVVSVWQILEWYPKNWTSMDKQIQIYIVLCSTNFASQTITKTLSPRPCPTDPGGSAFILKDLESDRLNSLYAKVCQRETPRRQLPLFRRHLQRLTLRSEIYLETPNVSIAVTNNVHRFGMFWDPFQKAIQ